MRLTVRRALIESDEVVIEHLVKGWSVAGDRIKLMRPELVKWLRYQYVMNSLCQANIDEGGGEYLSAVRDCGAMAIVSSVKGVMNTARCCLRQEIELVLRFLYFCDHPVELQWVRSRDDVREFGFQFLLDYVRRYPGLEGFVWREELLSVIASAYAECSRFVHVHSEEFLFPDFYSLTDEEARRSVRKLGGQAEAVLPALALLLIAVRRENFLKASDAEQYLVRWYLRRNWKEETLAVLTA